MRGNAAILRASKATAAASSSSSSSSSSSEFTPAQHPHFDLLRTTRISEYDLDAALYRHKSSGAQLMSVRAPDDNKVFGITFRTPPADSTGVAHILEHSVLCGSRKFKSKEPFVDLIKGSVNTFLNAFTYPDRTCYPVASQNTKDFYNLVDVYMDAVLHPRAMKDPQVLQQEGWHYELTEEGAPLVYKGVVFNEMKGVYSSSDALLGKATQEALFPDNAYSVDSGGDPKHIPSLTFDDFKSFHATTYHPSNSRIYFYGDDDPSKRLELMHSYLSDYTQLPDEKVRSTSVSPQSLKPNLQETPLLEVKYPVEPEQENENGHMITVNWLLQGAQAGKGTPLSSKDELAISILNHLLLGTSSAVLQKTLTESQLGESVTGGGLSDELVQPTFSVGMKGVSADNVQQVQQLVLSTLEDVSKTGFDEEAIRASVNSIEFDLREFNTGGFPRGLSLMLGFMSNWIYDRDPFEAIRFEEALTELKSDLKAGKPVFQDLIRTHFLSNGHRVSVVMVPDGKVAAEEEERERLKLQQVKEGMSSEQLQQIIRETAQLKAAQEAEDSPEAKATIPRLALGDLDAEPREIPITVQRSRHHDLLLHPLSSSGILYADIGLDYSSIPLADAPLLPLFARMLTEAGTTTRSQVDLSRFIGAETGGIGASWNSGLRKSQQPGTVKEDSTDVTLYLMLRGKCTADKTETLFEIFSDILLNAQLDNKKRAVEMLLELKARRMNSVVGSGHSYGMARLASQRSFLGYLGEHTGGLSYLRSVDDLLEQMENDWPSVQRRLEGIRRSLLAGTAAQNEDTTRPARVVINLTGDDQILQDAKQPVDSFLHKLTNAVNKVDAKSTDDKGMVQDWLALQHNEQQKQLNGEGISVPTQVNYVVKGGRMFQPGETVRGSHAVVARYLGTGYLWDTVRVMGGAYGGFGRFSPYTGNFVFASYRDPNVAETLEIYDKAGEALKAAVTNDEATQHVVSAQGEVDQDMSPATATHYTIPRLSEEDITQSVIGFMGDLDSPLSSDQKGYASMCNYIAGETEADRARWRREVLETNVDDFRVFADKLDALVADTEPKLGKAGVVVVGSQTALEKANSVLPTDKQLKISPAFPVKS